MFSHLIIYYIILYHKTQSFVNSTASTVEISLIFKVIEDEAGNTYIKVAEIFTKMKEGIGAFLLIEIGGYLMSENKIFIKALNKAIVEDFKPVVEIDWRGLRNYHGNCRSDYKRKV